jgi:hypothetical protein
MARWTEDRERGQGGRPEDERRWRGEGEWRGRDRRDEERGGSDWRAGDWRGGERGEWRGGGRDWENRDRGGAEWERERGEGRGGDEWRGGEWRGGDWGGGEGRGRYEERGGLGVGWRGDEDRYGPGTGRGASFGAGGMYGGTGGAHGGSSYGGSGLGATGYPGTFRGGRGGGSEGWRGDEGRWGRGERELREHDSGFTRDLRRYGGEDRDDDRGPLDRMGDKMREGWRKLTGRGPKGYRRSDERIREDVSERIARSWVNAEEVEVKVENGEVTLTGFVESREDKRMLEDLADDVFGVDEVHDHVRLRREHRGQEAGQPQTSTGAGQAQPQGTQGTQGTAARPGQPQQPGARH